MESVIHHAYLMVSVETPKVQGLESLQVAEHLEVLGEFCAGEGKKALCLFLIPCPEYLFIWLLICILYYILYNKMVNLSVAP